MKHQEIEVRFLEIDKNLLLERLRELGAEDHGEELLEEVIIYDKNRTWRDGAGKMLRLRTRNGKTVLSYKHHREQSATGVEEIEFEVGDARKAEDLLERLGYEAYRRQQKKRHSLRLGEVVVDIDTWPRIPAYVELEGPSVDALRQAAADLDLPWDKVEMRDPRTVIEEQYGIPVGMMTWFTFDRFE